MSLALHQALVYRNVAGLIFCPAHSDVLRVSSKAALSSYQCVYWSGAFHFLQELLLCVHSSGNLSTAGLWLCFRHLFLSKPDCFQLLI